MNQRARFIRKIVYAVAIAALLLPLSWLSQPATTESKGGLLAQMREENQLSQATLGEIDPASETIKLATLGMRGPAANILWEQANYYKKVEDWTSYSAALEQIIRLQPNFVSVWVFQGWNLAYNISVEFDDYRDRYHWVIKGIDFLQEGTKYNKDEPRLMSNIGWTIAQKIGRSDEHVQFRRLFREDDDFNGSRPRAQRDNWLVGREKALQAAAVVDRGVPLRGESPLLFHAHPAMYLINYCEALEEEGTFGEVAKNAWKKAGDSWTQFSNRDLPTIYNFTIRLSELEAVQERSKQAQAELDRLIPAGLREKIAEEKLAALPPEERKIHDRSPEELTQEERGQVYSIKSKLDVSALEIADRVTGDNRAAALKAAEEVVQADFVARAIDTERGIVNFDYWRLRCQVEPTDDVLTARKLIYDADRALLGASSSLPRASENYTEGLKQWRKVLDTYPKLLEDANLIDELYSAIMRYRSLLSLSDEPFPQPFILQDVLDQDVTFHGPRSLSLKGDAKAPDQADPAQPAEPAVPEAPTTPPTEDQ